MSAREGEAWFVVRNRPIPGSAMDRSRRGVVPVTRAGYLTFVLFFISETIFIALALALYFFLAAPIWVSAVVLVFGMLLSAGFLLLTIVRRTDYAITIDEYRAQQRRNG